MTKNPLVNALAGLLYIAGVVSIIFYAPHVVIVEESIFVPIAMLSLFVFSASTMSYLFLYEPLCLLLDGKRKEAVVLFFQTLGVFAASAVVLLLLGIFVLT